MSWLKAPSLFEELQTLPAGVVALGLSDAPPAAHSLVYVDRRTECGNMLMLGAAGCGKTNLLRGVIAQDLAHGGSVVIVDERVSGASFRRLSGLSNLYTGYRIAKIHDLLVQVGEEIEARMASYTPDDGLAEFMPLTVAVDGLTVLKRRLVRHWMHAMPVGGDPKSPALSALNDALSIGRMVGIRVAATNQGSTALDVSREQFPVRVLARQSPLGWASWAPQIERPEGSRIPGRMHTVFGGQATETQVPLWTDSAALEWASRGLTAARPFPSFASTTWGDQ